MLRRLVAAAPAALEPHGWLVCECGAGQAPAVRGLMEAAGAGETFAEPDLAGIERVAGGPVVTAAERALRAGALAIVPTDTVYGIGCAAFDRRACARLYASKARPLDQPTALALGSVANLLENVLPEVMGRAGVLCGRVLPGAVTLVVPNPGRRFAYLCGATPDRIGVRVPALTAEVAALADAVGGLALTSANLRGEPAPARLADVPVELRELCAVQIDGGEIRGTPSSVVDVCGPAPVLLRRGPDADSVMALLG